MTSWKPPYPHPQFSVSPSLGDSSVTKVVKAGAPDRSNRQVQRTGVPILQGFKKENMGILEAEMEVFIVMGLPEKYMDGLQ